VKTSDFRKTKLSQRSKPNQFTLAQAAKMAGISEGRLVLLIDTEQFTPCVELQAAHPLTGEDMLGYHRFIMTDDDVKRLRKLIEHEVTASSAKTTKKLEREWVDDGKQQIFTVAQVASILHYSEDTIRRLFESEPGVLVKGERNPRGKRRRVTLRIPRAVMERVKRRLANK
jgi:hypothetical protein